MFSGYSRTWMSASVYSRFLCATYSPYPTA
jgi:hypothetical protein